MIALADDDAAAVARLSERHRELLILISKGFHAVEIGQMLHLSPFTIRDHEKKLYRALDVHTRVEAAVIAAKAGLV